MKIIFYPRDIGLWRKTFDFSDSASRADTLEEIKAALEKPSKVFNNRNELMEFCSEHGVRLDDPKNPFEFVGPGRHHVYGDGTYTIVQWTVQGYAKEIENE